MSSLRDLSDFFWVMEKKTWDFSSGYIIANLVHG